jgi:hypothetical protein
MAKTSRTAPDASKQGLRPQNGTIEILWGLGPAGQAPSIYEGESSPLVGEQQPYFSNDILPPGGASGVTLLGPDPIPEGGHFTVNFDPHPDVQSSVDTAAVKLNEGSYRAIGP